MSPRMHVEGAGSVEIENGQGHTFTLGAWRKRLRCWRLRLPCMKALRMSVHTEHRHQLDAYQKHLRCWRLWLVYRSALRRIK